MKYYVDTKHCTALHSSVVVQVVNLIRVDPQQLDGMVLRDVPHAVVEHHRETLT